MRQPQIAYLASFNNNIQLWAIDAEGKSPHRIGNFNKAIFDFDAAPNGEYLIFSALNDKQGADLWYVDRNGNSLRLLVLCGADRCTSPTISPDSQQVAYHARDCSHYSEHAHRRSAHMGAQYSK